LPGFSEDALFAFAGAWSNCLFLGLKNSRGNPIEIRKGLRPFDIFVLLKMRFDIVVFYGLILFFKCRAGVRFHARRGQQQEDWPGTNMPASYWSPTKTSRRSTSSSLPTGDNSNQNKGESPELQGIKKGEYWLIGVGIATLAVNIGIAKIYLGQLRQMTKATLASERSANAACLGAQISRSSLIEMQQGETQARAQTTASIYQAIAAIQAQSAHLK
jgi:hypothetical protein